MESYLSELKGKTFFWLACLFVCFCCLLFSPVHVWETICMEHNFSRARNIRTVILHVNWFILIKKHRFWWKKKIIMQTGGVWGTYFLFRVEASLMFRKYLMLHLDRAELRDMQSKSITTECVIFKDILGLSSAPRTALPDRELASACCSCCFHRDKMTCCWFCDWFK